MTTLYLYEILDIIQTEFNFLDDCTKIRFITYVINYLGYREPSITDKVQNEKDNIINEIILSSIYPEVNFKIMATIYAKDETLQFKFLNRMLKKIKELSENDKNIDEEKTWKKF